MLKAEKGRREKTTEDTESPERRAEARQLGIRNFVFFVRLVAIFSCHAVALGVGGRHQVKRCFI